MDPVVKRSESMVLAGISGPLRLDAIKGLWQTLTMRSEEIPGRIGEECYAVIENDVLKTGKIAVYRACIAVDSADPLPAWCEIYTWKAGRYARFEHRGEPRNLSQTVAEIQRDWAPKLPGLFTIDYEIMRFPAHYDPNAPEAVFEYWLPLP